MSLDVRIQDVVLAGIAGALARWTGERIWRIDLESHGRDLPDHPGDRHEHDDVSRTIGWFTRAYPVRLTASRDDDPIATLRDVRAAVPAIALVAVTANASARESVCLKRRSATAANRTMTRNLF